ncbi:MAG: DUF2505 domain-containing protein [Actinomycetota bacterium]|nr:DUF2505 domain-containing protein [Actinomycetota bacterium]
MHFQLEQRFAAPLVDVEAALTNPHLLELVAAASSVGRPELLELIDEGDIVRQKVRYAFTGHLSVAARAVVDPARLTWVDESVHDRRTHRSEFVILPDHYPDRLQCHGTVTLAEVDGVTRRLTDADLRVTVRFLGGRVEQAIVSGLRQHAATEEQVVQRWLDQHAADGA